MQCQEIQDLLSAYLDGMLDPSLKDSTDRHLRECPACRAEFDDLKMVVGLVRDLPLVEPPGGFRQSLRHKLESKAGQVRKDSRLSRLATGRWSGMAAAAASFLLVFGLAAAWYGVPGRYGVPDQQVRVGSYNARESAAPPAASSVSKGTDGSHEMLPSSAKYKVTESGAVLSEQDARAEQAGSIVTTASTGSQDSAAKNPPPVNGPGLMEERKLAVENGAAGVAARGVAAITSASQAEQPKHAVIDIKVDQKNADIRGTLEGIARKYNGITAVLPETGGKEIIIKVPGSQFEKTIADIGKTGTVVRQDFSAQEADVDFMMVDQGPAAKAQEVEKPGKGGGGPEGSPAPGAVIPPGGSQTSQQAEGGYTMATIRVRLQ